MSTLLPHGNRTKFIQSHTTEADDRSRWGKVLERALTTTPLDSRAFRAGVILNPLRGLTAVENGLSQFERDIPSPVRPTDKTGTVIPAERK